MSEEVYLGNISMVEFWVCRGFKILHTKYMIAFYNMMHFY